MFTAQIMDAENGILRRDMRSKWYRIGTHRCFVEQNRGVHVTGRVLSVLRNFSLRMGILHIRQHNVPIIMNPTKGPEWQQYQQS